MPSDLVIGGWTIRAYPLLLDEIMKRIAIVEAQRQKDPQGYKASADYKLLLAMRKLMFETIPADPIRPEHRHGGTNAISRHWFRAKFGNGRFRLFFRFDSTAKIIVYAWVNDERTLRQYGSRSDAYATFRKLLSKNTPPEGWKELLAASTRPEALATLETVRRSTE